LSKREAGLGENRFDAVMFDLDGTLLDTIEDLADSMNEVLTGLGHPVHSVSSYCFFVGDGMENLVRRALPEDARDEESVAEGARRMRDVYRNRWNRKTRPYEGIPELLSALQDRGLRLTVLSNKPDGFTKLCVAEWFDEGRFAVVRGARPGIPRKPDPTAAVEIASELGLEAERILYLGDTNTDMKTAAAAGMFAVGAAWGFRPVSELLECGAKAIVEHPSEVLALIGE
jgi:phosphoglycolate phosphatase